MLFLISAEGLPSKYIFNWFPLISYLGIHTHSIPTAYSKSSLLIYLLFIFLYHLYIGRQPIH
jgi:hypothetical protein